MKMITETADPLPHWLPVLLMFLKLPKLFNFHILRLAAEREISKEEDRQGLRRRKIFSHVLVRACSHHGGDGDRDGDAPSACPAAASPFWFMLFFLLFFFLSLMGEDWPGSLTEQGPSKASDSGREQRCDADLWTQFQSSRIWSLRTHALCFGGQRGRAALEGPLGPGSLVHRRGRGRTRLWCCCGNRRDGTS